MPLSRLNNILMPPTIILRALINQNATNPTPSVRFLYDAFFPLMTYMIDGVGRTKYQYHPVGSLGALHVKSEDGPFANDVIGYQYDELSRIVRRTVAGNTEAFSYDALGRLVSDTNQLGAFSMSYLGQTRQITALNNGTVGTNWSYESNLNDRRLHSITNTGVARGYLYTTTPEDLITTMTETGANATAAGNWAYGYDADDRLQTAQSSATTQYGYTYDPGGNLITIQSPGGTSTATPNGLNQIGSLNGTAFSYDASGNLVHDDQHTYQWDAENRLIGIGYNAQPSQQTTFRYDGLGRRIAIMTTNGGVVYETQYLWCGEVLCQARTANDAVSRRYFPEGEEITSAGALLYYARDHLGSVRDLLVTQNGSPLASYNYDPHGNTTQASGQIVSSVRYAGMFYHQDSGLYLTHYRAYDPRTGRWLSRDPIGEFGATTIRSGTMIDGAELAGSMAALHSGDGFDLYAPTTDMSGDAYVTHKPEGLLSDSLKGVGTNLYSYADNNPVNQVDPLGNQFVMPFPRFWPPSCKRDCDLEVYFCAMRATFFCTFAGAWAGKEAAAWGPALKAAWEKTVEKYVCVPLYGYACYLNRKECNAWNARNGF
jgi:RHS repeat-associated protein